LRRVTDNGVDFPVNFIINPQFFPPVATIARGYPTACTFDLARNVEIERPCLRLT
jgi:hypothetical protein